MHWLHEEGPNRSLTLTSHPLNSHSCIIDRQPRLFDAESCALLANIAEMVVREIEKDKAAELQVCGVSSVYLRAGCA